MTYLTCLSRPSPLVLSAACARPMQWAIHHLSHVAWANIDVIARLCAAHVNFRCPWAMEDLRQVVWASAVLGQ